MALKEETKWLARKVLTAVNYISRAGGVDATVSGNATITALCNAILALPFNAGGAGEGINQAIVRGLKLGVTNGILSETHGFTTITGMRDGVFDQISDMGISATFANDLP
jgi:hypothetical protein